MPPRMVSDIGGWWVVGGTNQSRAVDVLCLCRLYDDIKKISREVEQEFFAFFVFVSIMYLVIMRTVGVSGGVGETC